MKQSKQSQRSHTVKGTFQGRPVTHELSAHQSRQFQKAREVGYLVKVSRGVPSAARAWWADCEVHDRPNVVVTLRPKTAEICVDMYTTGHNLTPEAVVAIRRLIHDRGLKAIVGPVVVDLRRVPRELVEDCAKEIVAIIQDNRRATEQPKYGI